RLPAFLGHSPSTDAMLEGDRWEQLRRTIQGDDELVASKSIEALIKPVGVVRGASDVTFHRDCHLGRHPYGCSGATVGVSVSSSSDANGRLRVAAGSTEPGDLTVHLSCTLHEAQPPKTEARKVMYAGFSLAPRSADDGTGA